MDALKHVPLEKLKKLEERFIIPSNNSNIVSHTDTFIESYQKENNDKSNNSGRQQITKAKYEKETITNTFNESEKNDQKINFLELMNEKNSSKSDKNNSNKSLHRKTTKSDKKIKTYTQGHIEFLTNKRMRLNGDSSNNFSIFCNEKLSLDDQIEFSSKNVVSSSKLFNKDTITSFTTKNDSLKKNKNRIEHFFTNNNTTSNNVPINITNINTNNSLKINNFFQSTSSPQNSNETLQKQLIVYKEKMDQMTEERNKIIKDLNEKKRLYDKEIEKLIEENNETKENLMNFNHQFKLMESQLSQTKLKLIKYLRELEEAKRREKKKWIYEVGYKVCRQGLQRMSAKIVDVWEDGEDIITNKRRLLEIVSEKNCLEKEWNKITLMKKNIIKENIDNKVVPTEKLDEEEKMKLINFKMQKLNIEENEIKEKLEKLDQEKILYQLEYKRICEEGLSRYGAPNSKEKWPVLNNKYLILSLLGKGGYSEVYKAFDLENNIEVACKIHELNSSWSNTLRDCYIKHAIRENDIYKQIKHPKVVNHYDTFEIDQNSFCSVLELCSGPDLYTYLKLHKVIPEKEAKFIITQLLSALKYLNERDNKIIHFDLKPQNILFHNGEVKIADFGLAKVLDDHKDQIELTSQGVGTYWYLPPECFETDKNKPIIDSKVDIWSTGVIFFELLYGQKPFGNGMTQEKIFQENIIRRAKKVDFPDRPIISNECKDFIKKCLNYNKLERYDVQFAWNSAYIRGQKGQ